MATLIDTYDVSNAINFVSYSTTQTIKGNSFTNGYNTPATLTACKFYLRKTGAPSGSMTALLFAHSGIFGSSSKPTGTEVATSDPISITTLSTTVNRLIEFTFSTPYTLSANTNYCIALKYLSLNDSNTLVLGRNATSPTHPGNYFFDSSGVYSTSATIDACFYVYGDVSVETVPIPLRKKLYHIL